MMHKRILCVGASFVLLGSAVCAATTTKNATGFTREEVYIQSKEKCIKFDSCDLKQIIFRTNDGSLKRESKDDLDMYWTKMYASYVTSSLAEIEKYAFVQFIRGCVFTSVMLPGGKVETLFNVVRVHGDVPEGKMLFRHPDWVVDSNDEDPVYSSDTSISDNRHFLYQWTLPHGAWNPDLAQGNLYGEKQVTFPQLYVTDRPTSAVLFSDGSAQNSSLEFRVCLYKTADIPKNGAGSDIDFAQPIKCFEWEQSYVYDHLSQSWTRPHGVVEECRRPLSEEEASVAKTLRDWFRRHP
jgi:hypothetical protein